MCFTSEASPIDACDDHSFNGDCASRLPTREREHEASLCRLHYTRKIVVTLSFSHFALMMATEYNPTPYY